MDIFEAAACKKVPDNGKTKKRERQDRMQAIEHRFGNVGISTF